MMLSKLSMSATSLNSSNLKRKRPWSFVSNMGPFIIQGIKKPFNPHPNSSTARRSNTVHCCLNDYQEEMSEKHALDASLIEEQDENIKLSWSQETFMCALGSDSNHSKKYVQHVENWWSTTP